MLIRFSPFLVFCQTEYCTLFPLCQFFLLSVSPFFSVPFKMKKKPALLSQIKGFYFGLNVRSLSISYDGGFFSPDFCSLFLSLPSPRLYGRGYGGTHVHLPQAGLQCTQLMLIYLTKCSSCKHCIFPSVPKVTKMLQFKLFFPLSPSMDFCLFCRKL